MPRTSLFVIVNVAAFLVFFLAKSRHSQWFLGGTASFWNAQLVSIWNAGLSCRGADGCSLVFLVFSAVFFLPVFFSCASFFVVCFFSCLFLLYSVFSFGCFFLVVFFLLAFFSSGVFFLFWCVHLSEGYFLLVAFSSGGFFFSWLFSSSVSFLMVSFSYRGVFSSSVFSFGIFSCGVYFLLVFFPSGVFGVFFESGCAWESTH